MIILSGILVMVIGLMLRFNALLVVIAAGFVTGLSAGLSINEIVGAIGEAFVKIVICHYLPWYFLNWYYGTPRFT